MDANQLAVDTLRLLSVDAINKANSGHPGLPLGAAPIVYTLYNDFLKFNPQNPLYENRDRFVLSAGHGSALLYSALHMFGYAVTIDDLKNFRQLHSITPGHPEFGCTPGVDVSTGPLGQGIANAVGMAIAETHLAAKFNKDGFPVVDHYTYALCGDGCMQEGIEYEAASLAGTLKLGKLIVFYDKNNITIEGSTDFAFTEDVKARHEAQGWQVLYVNDANNLIDLKEKITLAKEEKEKPTLIVCRTVIGYGSPLAGSASVHGSPLGEENTNRLREILGYDYPPFTVPEQLNKHLDEVIEKGINENKAWENMFAEYAKQYPALAKEYKQWMSGEFGDLNSIADNLDFSKPEATRTSGEKILNAIAERIPNLFGGSADLGPSNKTIMKNRSYYSCNDRLGSNMHFGIREHAMSAICNGIAAHGGILPYCSTFFVFSDYMKNGMRMSALMNLPVTYIFSHDSICVGEDGPTHEPIEQLAGLRSMPNMTVFRPCDGRETIAAYTYSFTSKKPTSIVLSRQNLPQLDGTGKNASFGAYVLCESVNSIPDLLLIASGSEVQFAVEAQKILREENIDARVISMPCMELFEAQTEEYKQSVIPDEVRKRVCIECGSSYSWYRYAGIDGKIIGIDNFGTSAPYKQLLEYYGFTTENIVKTARKLLNK